MTSEIHSPVAGCRRFFLAAAAKTGSPEERSMKLLVNFSSMKYSLTTHRDSLLDILWFKQKIIIAKDIHKCLVVKQALISHSLQQCNPKDERKKTQQENLIMCVLLMLN